MTDPTLARNATTLTLTRLFSAPRETVYRAWTDSTEMAKWWGPDGCSAPLCEIDLQPGGAWRSAILLPIGETKFVGGVYRTIQPPEKLAFTWAWEEDGVRGHETLVTLEFKDRRGSTELTLTQTGFDNTDDRDAHGGGWSSSLDCLERLISQT